MPELPDVGVYVERLGAFFSGRTLERVRVATPFVVRTYDPKITELHGKRVDDFRRLGKRIVVEFEGELFLVIHLMIAGRLHLKDAGAKIPGRLGLAAFDFPDETLLLTEAGTKKRASLHVVRGEAALRAFDRGGADPVSSSRADFRTALLSESHTLKRALTDPRLFSGIGNAYSDEILFHAGLSPVKLTTRLSEDEITKLHSVTRDSSSRGPTACGPKRAMAFPRRSPHFDPKWQCTASTGSLAPCAEPRCNEFATRRTRSTTARAVRPRGSSWRTEDSRGSFAATGRRASTSWRRSRQNGVERHPKITDTKRRICSRNSG